MKFRIRARIGGLLLLALSSASTLAASFDCNAARQPVEIAICAKPVLSQLDEELAQSYERARRALSAEGAASLTGSQRSWLHYVAGVCVVHQPSSATPPKADAACLDRVLRQRIEQLAAIGQHLGALVLTRIDRYEVLPNAPDDNTGGHNGMVVHHVAYPQFDGASPAAAAWNRAQVRALPRRGEGNDSTDYDTDYEIGCGNDALLSVKWVHSMYGHGAAHGQYSHTTATVLLEPMIHVADGARIFAAGSGWQTKLPTYFWQAFQQQGTAVSTDMEVEAAVRKAASDASRWLVTPRGLQIDFDAYEAGSYAETPGPITVPWDQLKPMLVSKTAPACRVAASDMD